MTFHRILDEGRSALGLAIVPTLVLGALGSPESVTVPVLLSSFATAFAVMLFD